MARPSIRLHGLDVASARRKAADLLALVGLSAGTHHQRPQSLSGGERQRAGIARALAAEPAVLICDEITSALDPDTRDQILDLLARLRESDNLSLFVITHDPVVVERLAGRAIRLSGNA